MIKVYFGPWKHSPVGQLKGGEATFAIGEFHLLRGYDQDFWTNNPFVLDCFNPKQIMVWDDKWIPLDEAVGLKLPGSEVDVCARLNPGRQALVVETIRLFEIHVKQQHDDRSEADVERAKAEIRAAMLNG